MNENGLKLIEETVKEIKKSREEYKKSHLYSLKDIKKSRKI